MRMKSKEDFFRKNEVHPSFKYGRNFKIGLFNIIEEGVVVGDNVTIENYAWLKKGTIIGNDVHIDSYVRTGGGKLADNKIGDGCWLKIRVTLSPDTQLGDRVFMGPHSMVLHGTLEGKHEPALIGDDVYIGACSLVGPGVSIVEKTVLGAYSYANKSLIEPGVYVGCPADRM